MIVNVTVNLANGEEYTHEKQADNLSEIGGVIDLALDVESVGADEWSSVLVTVVNK